MMPITPLANPIALADRPYPALRPLGKAEGAARRQRSVGVGELDQEKLTPLLRLKYHNSIADAVADLGRPEEIGRVFSGFQRYLYQGPVCG